MNGNDTTIRRLLDHMAKHCISQNAVASACGQSAATLSYWIKGKYSGDNEEVERKVRDYLRREAGRRDVLKSATVATRCYRTAVQFLDMVAQHQIMGLMTGDAGCGKTTAIKDYVRNNPTVMLIEADHGYTASVLFRELCEILNLDSRGSIHDLLNRVVGKLSGSGRLLVVDEAEHLPYRALELIRRVYDKAGVGIALCGMPRLVRNIKGDPTHYAQLNSRIALPCRVRLLSDDDARLVLAAAFGQVPDDVVKAAQTYSERNARLLSHIIRWSRVLMDRHGCALSPDVVKDAAQYLTVAAA